jgi:chitin disaccharide deacetylase
MLIVNADDLGRNTATTDAILSCYANKRISATSAMVFMEDSGRAAELALTAGIDVGLHINFSERFSAQNIPNSLGESHGKIIRFLKVNKYALLLYHPLLAGEFRSVFEAQQAEFFRLYGRLPSHYDGHQHLHLASNMLIQQVLPKGSKVRRSFSFSQGEKSFVNRFYRNIVDRSLARRHTLADYFFSLSHYLALEHLAKLINLAQDSNVELMAHPHIPKEYEFLMSDGYGELLSQINLEGFNELR